MSEQVSALADVPLWRRLVRAVRRYFAERFGDVTRSEASGYAVWGAMGIVIGVPEIWAAVSGDDFYWPTISTTIGHLQERWPVVALLPVAAIVMGAYSVFRVGAAGATLQADFRALERTPQGRLTKHEVSVEQLAAGGGSPPLTGRRHWDVVPYFAIATAVVVAGTLAAVPSENRFLVGYVLYSLIAVFWVIVPNLAAYFFKRDVPFTTLFFTVSCLGRRLQVVAALVAALLVILLLHLAFYPWPSPD
jgi:hypothetical protein